MSDFSTDEISSLDKKELYKAFRIVTDTPDDFVPFGNQDPVVIAKFYEGQDDDIVYVTSTGKIGICMGNLDEWMSF